MIRPIILSLCIIIFISNTLLASDYAGVPVTPTHLEFSAPQNGPLPVAQSVTVIGPGGLMDNRLVA